MKRFGDYFFRFIETFLSKCFTLTFTIPHSLKISSVGELLVHQTSELCQQIEQFSTGWK